MILNFILSFILITIAVYSLQKITSGIVCNLNSRIKIFIDSKKNGDKFKSNSEFKKETENFDLIIIKKKSLGIITKIVGYFETIFFIILTVVILKNPILNYNFIFSVIGIWLGLKIFGGYQQWSGPVLGRATFYVFLIGSVFNIIGSIILGFILFLLLTNSLI